MSRTAQRSVAARAGTKEEEKSPARATALAAGAEGQGEQEREPPQSKGLDADIPREKLVSNITQDSILSVAYASSGHNLLGDI